jgi:hypothetical protein
MSKQRSYSIVHHDIINYSTSHHKYSFGKGRRFINLKPNPATDYTVTLGSTMHSNKSPTFGVGNRFRNVRNTRKLRILLIFSSCNTAP